MDVACHASRDLEESSSLWRRNDKAIYSHKNEAICSRSSNFPDFILRSMDVACHASRDLEESSSLWRRNDKAIYCPKMKLFLLVLVTFLDSSIVQGIKKCVKIDACRCSTDEGEINLWSLAGDGENSPRWAEGVRLYPHTQERYCGLTFYGSPTHYYTL